MIKILKVILILLLLVCLMDMPYGYFQFVRFSGFVIFLILFFNEKNSQLKIFWIVSALLINPFIKIALGRFIWNIIDVFWAIILVFTFFIEKEYSSKK